MLKRLYLFIAGDDQSFRFEHRIFNLSSFILAVFCIQGTIINYLLGLHPATVWLAAGGSFFSIIIFYITRVRKYFTPGIIILYAVATICILSPLHFFNGASEGPTIYLLIMLLNIFLLIAPAKMQLWLYGMYTTAILGMFLVEYLFPDWTIAYNTPSQRIVDHVTVMLYSLFFTMIVIRLFRRSYDREQKIILQQKLELQKAYENTTEKNKYIESLIKELHHRVKNNLQVVSSLLSLQSNRIEDDKARTALEDGRKRVDAMAMIHQRLYMDHDMAAVNIEEYLQSLAASIAGSFGYTAATVKTKFNLQHPDMHIDQAIPIGLIVNELVTNSFKHAFNGIADPKVEICLEQTGTNIVLLVEDNGTGFVSNNSEVTFGMKLVKTLVSQLDGELAIQNIKGARFVIKISN